MVKISEESAQYLVAVTMITRLCVIQRGYMGETQSWN